MPNKLFNLRARHDFLARELQALVDKEKTPEWKPEHQAKYDQNMAEIADIRASIDRQTAVAALNVEKSADGTITDDLRNEFTATPGKHANPAETRALKAYLAGGLQSLAPEDAQRMLARQRAMSPQAAMSTGVPSEGGFTVAPEYYSQLTEALKAFGGIREAAFTLQSGSGALMNFPATNATTEEGEIVGENALVARQDTTFNNISIPVYKYTSKDIALPFELIQDSMFDMEGYINRLLAMRIGRITSRHFTVGTGTGQPRGINTAAAIGKVGVTGQVATVTYDDLIDLEHSVDPLYRSMPGVGYMLSDSTLAKIRKIKDTSGRPIFVPGYEQGNPGGAPDRLLGRPIFISQEMPAMAASAKSILFGDFKSYFIREVMDLTLFRMADSFFVRNGQIGFIAFNRQGGNLIDVGGAVKAYQNSAT